MLQSVKDPKGKTTAFEYDALGRRTAKINYYKKEINRYIYDGNVLLHEFSYDLAEKPKVIADDLGRLSFDKEELTNNLITWVFDEGTFVPQAKIVDGKTYSIISDYLGTPILSFDDKGNKVWERELDIYGKVKKGDNSFVPFLYQGQYYDEETELAYNRFRYYNPDSGSYISQDPIGLDGGTNFYQYVNDPNHYIDPLGLAGMPKNGWNYNNMPKIDGYQNHHVIPRSKANHPAIKAAGFDVDKPSNLIYLPKEDGTHPTRSKHKGWNKGHADYNKAMTKELDDIAKVGKANNWNKAQYSEAIEGLRGDTRQGLRKGKIKCH
jgi:RHS repeat-associated protein